MASTIAAGTTSGTAIAIAGDTSGVLQLQTNGTTAAVTIDTNQRAAFVAGTAALPAITTTGDTNTGIFFPAADTIAFSEGGAEAMRIDSAGVVSIKNTGSTADFVSETSTSLIVGNGSGTQAMTVYSGTANNGALYFADGNTGDATYRGAVQYLHGSDAMRFFTSAAERMRLNSSGQLLVGATSTVFTNDTTGGSFQGSQTGGGKPILEAINTDSTSGSDNCPAIIAAKGSSTTSSSARFIQFSASSASQPMGGIVGNGATNCQFASISDAREKTNIQEISGSLEKINALKPVEFDWIRDNSHVNAGFVAQDVQQVFPEFVVNNMSDEGQEQRYGLTGGMTGGIIAHLVKAIQELNAKVDAQAVRIAELEGAR